MEVHPTIQTVDLKQKLQSIAPTVFKGSPVRFAYLYGSHAQGKTHPFSDLDIGVFVEGLDLKTCLDLELSLSLKIDEILGYIAPSEVRVINYLPLSVKGQIMLDSQLIYSRDENKRIEFETQTRLAYFDFMPVIKQYQNIYREKALSELPDGLH